MDERMANTGHASECPIEQCSHNAESHTQEAERPLPIPVLGVASIFHAEYLLRCIRSIDFPVEVLVVVHNGEDVSVADAIATLQRERPKLRVVRVPDNSGCAGGWNRIIAENAKARCHPWDMHMAKT